MIKITNRLERLNMDFVEVSLGSVFKIADGSRPDSAYIKIRNTRTENAIMLDTGMIIDVPLNKPVDVARSAELLVRWD